MHVQNRSSFPSEKSETFKRIDNNPHLHRNLIFLHDTAKKTPYYHLPLNVINFIRSRSYVYLRLRT